MKYTNLSECRTYFQRLTPELCPALLFVTSSDPFLFKEVRDLALYFLENNGWTIRTFHQDHPVHLIKEAFFSRSLFTQKEAFVVSVTSQDFFYEEMIASPTVALFLSQGGGQGKLYKAALQEGVVFDIPEIKPWDRPAFLTHWIQEYMRNQGKMIPAHCAATLAKEVPYDPSVIAQELEKVCLFVGERPVTLEDLQTIGVFVSEHTPWQFVEAIFQQQTKEALMTLSNLMLQEVHPFVLMKTLRTSLHNLCIIASLLENNAPINEIAERFGQFKGKVLEKNIQTAHRNGLKKLVNALSYVDEMEEQCKNGLKDPIIALQLITVQLAGI